MQPAQTADSGRHGGLRVWLQLDRQRVDRDERGVQLASHDPERQRLLTKYALNELPRIATTDRILMKMALAEAQTFDSIPLKVTLNEYIELSKYYSTPKSHGFINGILDQLFTQLKESGGIKKVGRGLIE